MPLPSIADAAQQYLFTDRDKMIRSGVPEATINHIIRIRDVYSYWLQFPQKKDREIVGELMRRGNIQRSAAYEDLRLIKQLLGDLNKVQRIMRATVFYRWSNGLTRWPRIAVTPGRW